MIEKVYVGYWFWGRPSPDQLWADLQEIHQRIKADFDPTTPEARAAWEAQQVRRPPERIGRLGRRADAGQYLPHGRRDRRGGPRGDRVLRARGAVHGLDRRHVGRPGRRRRHDRLGALGVGRRRRVRQRRGLPELHRLADEVASAGVDTAFGRNLERLAQVKAKYDPDNFFRVNHNIQPAERHPGRRAIRVGAPPGR